jgi:Terminase RNaseH-like domain
VKPDGDKTMRFNAQTATIENGFVYLPVAAPHWLTEFLHEITTFPAAKHDDQADSLAQALEWINKQPGESEWLSYIRHDLARDMRNRGHSVEQIAAYLEVDEEEVRRWFQPRDGSKTFSYETIPLNLPRCHKCGETIPFNVEFVRSGENYHIECWRKMTQGQ